MSDKEYELKESPTLTVILKHLNLPEIKETDFPFNLEAFCRELDEIQFQMIWLIENGRPSADLPKIDRDRWITVRKELGFAPPDKERSKLILMPNSGKIIT